MLAGAGSWAEAGGRFRLVLTVGVGRAMAGVILERRVVMSSGHYGAIGTLHGSSFH